MSNTLRNYDNHVGIYGMMLAGKTTVSQKLAKVLDMPSVDTDEYVVSRIPQKSISEFIDSETQKHGSEKAWDNFAGVERECIQELTASWQDKKVISFEGRTLLPESNRELISSISELVPIYLELQSKHQIQRAKNLTQEDLEHRPALRDAITDEKTADFFMKMQRDRGSIYREFAGDRIVKACHNLDKIVQDILDILKK